MIDPLEETLWTMAEAAEFAKVNHQNIYSWTLKGVRGVVLESVQIGAKRFTSKEAMGRFIALQNDPAKLRELRQKTPAYIRSAKKRRQEAKQSSEKLRKAGA
jgi:hypothetical protein